MARWRDSGATATIRFDAIQQNATNRTMSSILNIPDSAQQAFALEVVRRLGDAGYEAVWAGGCVRDALLGIVPKDFDVATSATPEKVVALFGRRRTVTVGASFGVVVVLGNDKSAGQVEVATFRTDGHYSDGRRPDHVIYCSAEEDARRRDFTINAMFFDPVAGQVIDYVGGEADLNDRVVRAVGVPYDRIKEDKLRMLRAVRFSARFDFAVEPATLQAVREHAQELAQVSVERIAQELRRMLAHSSRTTAVNLLEDSHLLPAVFPNMTDAGRQVARQLLPFLTSDRFEPSCAVLLLEHIDDSADSPQDRTSAVRAECRRLKLSNEETDCIAWLANAFVSCPRPSRLPLHILKPLLADSRRNLFVEQFAAGCTAGSRSIDELTYLRNYLRDTPPDQLNPAPLISGDDLIRRDVEQGPEFSRILKQIRQEQLDERLTTREAALQRVDALRS